MEGLRGGNLIEVLRAGDDPESPLDVVGLSVQIFNLDLVAPEHQGGRVGETFDNLGSNPESVLLHGYITAAEHTVMIRHGDLLDLGAQDTNVGVLAVSLCDDDPASRRSGATGAVYGVHDHLGHFGCPFQNL